VLIARLLHRKVHVTPRLEALHHFILVARFLHFVDAPHDDVVISQFA